MGSKVHFIFLVLLFFCFALFGQESFWLMDNGDGTARIVQQISWASDENAFRYEVVIERETAGVFQEIQRESTEENRIEVSLGPGLYHYSVTAFNFLDERGPESQWVVFEILLALQPELQKFSPDHFNLNDGAKRTLTLTGRNLSPNAEVYLREPGSDESAIVSEEYSGNASLSSAKVLFDEKQLRPGNYEIYIKNPGGLEASLGTFRIILPENTKPDTLTAEDGAEQAKSTDFYIALDYAPLIPLYGQLNRLFDQPFFPLGVQLRFGILPWKLETIYLGLELTAAYQYFHSALDDYKVSFHAPAGELSFLFQKWVSPRSIAFIFHLGGGVGTASDFHFSYPGGKSEPVNLFMPRITTGVSILFMDSRSVFVEAGLDYMYWLTSDKPSPGYLRPRLGAGWKF